MVEVHTVDTCDGDGDGDQCGGGAGAAHVVVLLEAGLGEGHGQGVVDEFGQDGHAFCGLGEVVGDIAEVGGQFLVHAGDAAFGEVAQRPGERRDGSLEFDEFAFELIDAADVMARGRGEGVVLDLVVVGLQRGDDVEVPVDHHVCDGVQDGHGSMGEALGVGLQATADAGERLGWS